MKIITTDKWVYYTADGTTFNRDTAGKWMYYFYDVTEADEYCKLAVNFKVTACAKHANAASGICGFYTEPTDIEAHKRIIRFMLSNNLIRKTSDGKLFDISFKYETDNPESPRAKIRLSDFVDLQTGRELARDDYVQESFL